MTDEQKAQLIAEITQESEALEPNDTNGLTALYFKAIDAGLIRLGDDAPWIGLVWTSTPTSFDVHPEIRKIYLRPMMPDD